MYWAGRGIDPQWDDYGDLLTRCAAGYSIDAFEAVPAQSGDSLAAFAKRDRMAFKSHAELDAMLKQQWGWTPERIKQEQEEWEEDQRKKQAERERLATIAWNAEEQRRQDDRRRREEAAAREREQELQALRDHQRELDEQAARYRAEADRQRAEADEQEQERRRKLREWNEERARERRELEASVKRARELQRVSEERQRKANDAAWMRSQAQDWERHNPALAKLLRRRAWELEDEARRFAASAPQEATQPIDDPQLEG